MIAVIVAIVGSSSAAGCAPQATALERYCDVVHLAEAAYNPLATPGATADPEVLRKAIDDQVSTASALADVAPDATRGDAAVVRDTLIKLANALADKHYDAALIDRDTTVSSLLAGQSFQDARRRLDSFNSGRCD